ncbi:MAG: helicase-exonuclease AddAB subunit AddA [Clostridiales bacterium]|nr:helicase-exonuclease AddAB subunit AddA [Clostridiales bacterium]
MSIQLTPQQQAAVDHRGGELLVSAAAGSGKTRVLVERLLDRVEQEGLDVDRFLIITFTKAAASELRGKILQGLNQRLAEHPGDRHLRRQLTLVYQAQISTIHAYCTALLREFGYLLDLDPDFRVSEEGEAEILRRETLDRVMEARYETIQEGDAFSHLVDTMSAGRDDRKLKEIVLDIHARVQAHPHPEQWLREQSAAFDLAGVRDVGQTVWGRQIMERAASVARYWDGRMLQAINSMMADPALEAAYSPSFCDTMDSIEDFLNGLERGWDSACALCEIKFPTLGRSRKIEDKRLQEEVKAVRETCKRRMKGLKDLFFASNDTLLEDMASVRPAVEALFDLVLELDEAYTKAKRSRRTVDFNDLEHLTLKLLLDREGQPTPLASQLRNRYAEVMVDEYQDTNAVQNAIFDAITRDGSNLFQVGDVKQSIYRFRLADPTIFLHKYHTFPQTDRPEEGQPRTVVLSQNFRSRASVLAGVNFVFENIMSTQFGEMDYTRDQRLNPGFAYPEHPNDRVELDCLDLSALEREEDSAAIPRDQVEADFVARRVEELLTTGFPVTGEDGVLRPVQPGDIAVLYRSPGAVMGYLTQAMDLRNIPWQTEGAEDFFHTTEVSCAVSFLEIIDNPRQDVPLLSVLRSPMYAFSPDRLASLRHDCPDGDLYACLQQGAEHGDEPSRDFLRELDALRLRAGDVTCAQLLWQLYDRTGMLALFEGMDGGPRRREHLLALYDCARTFGQPGRQGLFDFVNWLRRLEEQGGRLPALGKAAGNGVRIMSIHRSKGLEFPVVILAGLNRTINRTDERAPVLFHPKLGVGPKGVDPELRIEYPTLARKAVQLKLEEETKAEELRLLYVAMTRAREKLIMTCSMTNAWKELGNLLPEAGPHPDPQALQEKDSVAKWLLLPVLARTDAQALRLGGSVSNPISASDWGIRLVPAEPPLTHSGRQAASPATEETAAETLDLSLLDWRYPWTPLSELPSKVTATQLKGRPLDEEVAQETRQPPAVPDFPRPRFRQETAGLTPAQRGTVLHTVMELVRLDRADSVQGVREELERLVAGKWLTRAEADSVEPSMVAGFYASDLGRAAAAAPDLRREFKFSLFAPAERFFPQAPAGEQVMLQGVVDCCFTGPEGLTVVDFKTDHVRPSELQAHSEGYRGQLEGYAWALEQIFGRPVVRKVLWYFRLGRGWEL